jgi:hypothetical protein
METAHADATIVDDPFDDLKARRDRKRILRK